MVGVNPNFVPTYPRYNKYEATEVKVTSHKTARLQQLAMFKQMPQVKASHEKNENIAELKQNALVTFTLTWWVRYRNSRCETV